MLDLQRRTRVDRLLDAVERLGNRLPDPAALFVAVLALTWVLSAWLDGLPFEVPSRGGGRPQTIQSQLTGRALVEFLADMLSTLTGFQPLGVALVALLGIGVAERSGFLDALLRGLSARTPKWSMTPLLMLLAIASHTVGEAAYALMIPLGALWFRAAGRPPLAGIAAAFAGVAAGVAANPIPSGLDPVLQGLTQDGVRIVDPMRQVDPLCNLYFACMSCVLVVGIGWALTDKLIEPRLLRARAPEDGEPKTDGPAPDNPAPDNAVTDNAATDVPATDVPATDVPATDVPATDVPATDVPATGKETDREQRGMRAGLIALGVGIALLGVLAYPHASPLRASTGALTDVHAPFMRALIPLVCLLLIVSSLVHGYVAGVFTNHRDVVSGMDKTMGTLGSFLVMTFGLALFHYAFQKSKLGALVAVLGGDMLRQLAPPGPLTLIGMILTCAFINLLIGSPSAKWAMCAPIFVPMFMKLGMSPELSQAAYRVGDATTDVVTPLLLYYPLVMAVARRYLPAARMGTLGALMLPYSVAFLLGWSILLVGLWAIGIPLGIHGVLRDP